MRRLAFPAVITAAAWAMSLLALTAALLVRAAVPASTAAAPASTAEPVPHCQPVLITTPWRTFTVHACDSGLRDPAPGKQWQWVVDGSALKGGAVVFGYQIPRQP